MATKKNKTDKLNPNISIDCVIFSYQEEELRVLLFEKTLVATNILDIGKKYTQLVLPGDLVLENEDLDQAAIRIIKEATDCSDDFFMEKFGTLGELDRVRRQDDESWLRFVRSQPEERVVTITYLALVKHVAKEPVNDKAKNKTEGLKKEWHNVSNIPTLAFDHNNTTEKALKILRNKLNHSLAAFELIPAEFTLYQLQKLYEAIGGKELDKRNFRRKIKRLDILIPLAEKEKGKAHKPATVFKLKPDIEDIDFLS